MPARRVLELSAILAFVIALAVWTRAVDGMRHRYQPPGVGDGRWFSRDADGLYHTRRVSRAIDEHSVAAHDPHLAYPDGAAIPWPPYYDALLACVLAPFVPDEKAERREFLERAVASAPFLCGIATCVIAAWIGWLLAGAGGALIAGSYHALTRGAINYTVIGNGDHHGFVSLSTALLFALLTRVLLRDARSSTGSAIAWGSACGMLAGAMLGSWVASLLTILLVQLVLGWLLVRRAQVSAQLAHLPAFGLAFHLACALTLLPAVLQSPWSTTDPWMIVNLSWFHLVELGLGALVFVPPVLFGQGALAPQRKFARVYPWLVAFALVALGAAIGFANVGPAAALREGWDWVARTNSFMDVVRESEPLVGARAEAGAATFALGFGLLFAPLALLALLWRSFFRGALALLPWAIAFVPMGIQTLQQRRFSEAFALPLAVALAWSAVELVRAAGARVALLARVPRFAWGVLALLCVGLAQAKTIDKRMQSADPKLNWAVGTAQDHYLGERLLYEWLYTNTPRSGDYSVLAHWDRGHALEWVADRPSVATNFGSYVGEDSYRDPPRFFMSEDPERAEKILLRRRARYVLAHGSLPLTLSTLTRANDDTAAQAHLLNGAPTERWLSTIGAMLLADGAARDAELHASGNSLGFLRLVHVSPFVDGRVLEPSTKAPLAAGTIWERVTGVELEARGAFGEELVVELDVVYPDRAQPLHFLARATIGESRVATVRMPYTTERNGEGHATGPARYSVGTRSGELHVSESAVQSGATLRLE